MIVDVAMRSCGLTKPGSSENLSAGPRLGDLSSLRLPPWPLGGTVTIGSGSTTTTFRGPFAFLKSSPESQAGSKAPVFDMRRLGS
jgi:hypothetical protein